MDKTEGDQPGLYKSDDGYDEERSDKAQEDMAAPMQDAISWTASEYVAHHKGVGWYLVVVLGLAAICGLIYVVTEDIISIVTIAVAGILFLILANKKPRELPYTLDERGITIGAKLYPYAAFKSFAVHQEGAIGWINLMPLKRFMPELSVYYPPEQQAEILDALSEYLPHDQRQEPGIDRLTKRLRF